MQRIRDIVATTGARSHNAIAKELERRGVTTARGHGAWQNGQVKAVLDRCGMRLAEMF
jgi:hypothetical protein